MITAVGRSPVHSADEYGAAVAAAGSQFTMTLRKPDGDPTAYNKRAIATWERLAKSRNKKITGVTRDLCFTDLDGDRITLSTSEFVVRTPLPLLDRPPTLSRPGPICHIV